MSRAELLAIILWSIAGTGLFAFGICAHWSWHRSRCIAMREAEFNDGFSYGIYQCDIPDEPSTVPRLHAVPSQTAATAGGQADDDDTPAQSVVAAGRRSWRWIRGWLYTAQHAA